MGKTILVKDLEICKECTAYRKVSCVYGISCKNRVWREDNSEPNVIRYEEQLSLASVGNNETVKKP